MKTTEEVKKTWWENDYYYGYRDAIDYLYDEIRSSEVISVKSIEKYLEKLLDESSK